MSKKPNRNSPSTSVAAKETTLATVLVALERPGGLSATRVRDLRSAVKRVAILLANEPAGIRLDMESISAGLAAVNPAAVGMTAKRLANIRSDFLAAVKASEMMPVALAKTPLSPAWSTLFGRLSGRRVHIGLSRLARYASGQGIAPQGINDEAIDGFIAAVRKQSLHRKPNALHRQVTLIWNEVAQNSELSLRPVTVPSFRGPPKRIDWALLPEGFRQDVDKYLSWCSGSDPFAADARVRPLAPRTLRLLRDQIQAAATALSESGVHPSAIKSLADLVAIGNLKVILRRRLAGAGGGENTFNRNLGKALVQIARTWVKVESDVLDELKRLVGKMPVSTMGLTNKNKRFLRQFDDPAALQRLFGLSNRLWAEVKREGKPNFRTLAKAQTALAIAILCYIPLRLQNLASLTFETHLFLKEETGAVSTLELPPAEVKNKEALAFDIPTSVAKMLTEYRDHIAPKVIGHRPTRLFVNANGTPKSQATVAYLIAGYSKARAGLVLTPHQFRHLSAKVLLDDQPGAFETVKQLLGHKSLKTTVGAYAGIDSRRAARHHQRLIDQALAAQKLPRRRIRQVIKKPPRKGD